MRTKTDSQGFRGEKCLPEGFFPSFFCLFDCDVERGSGGQLTLEPPAGRFIINLQQGPELNARRMTFCHLGGLKPSSVQDATPVVLWCDSGGC